MSNDPLFDKIERIADKLAEDLLSGDTNAQHVDTFKALSLYLVQTRKLDKRHGSDDAGATFGKIRQQLTEVSGNGSRQN